MEKYEFSAKVRIWLFIGVCMVFIQIIIGGVTRLTDSGLSITEWNIIQGVIPPMSLIEWENAFELYKSAANQQFMALHSEMSLDDFKFIYFWEYFHRLWARVMGIVFLIPFIVFLFKEFNISSHDKIRFMPYPLLKRLGIVIFLASLAAIFGIVMVYSGFNDDNRTWVSAYKLVVHLGIATALFGYLVHTWLLSLKNIIVSKSGFTVSIKYWLTVVFFLLVIQVLLGGLMAGMRAGLVFPYFPLILHFDKIQAILSNSDSVINSIIDYEASAKVKLFVQFFHRVTAIILLIASLRLSYMIYSRDRNNHILNITNMIFISLLVSQVVLGVLTVLNSIGGIPLVYGVIHQGLAFLLLGVFLALRFIIIQSTK